MNAAWIWVLVPLGLGVGLWLWRPPTQRGAWVATAAALVLAGLAWALPIGQPVPLLGRWTFFVEEGIVVLGRRLALPNAMRPWLVLLYGGTALWLAGAFVARMPAAFPGLALGWAALGTAALAVRPFLYAPLMLFSGVLALVPWLVTEREGTLYYRGALRWLGFLGLGLPFLLFTGWMLSGVTVGLADQALVTRALIFLGLGFALWLNLFPFHSAWPLLGEEASPYWLGWLGGMFTGMVGVLALVLLDRHAWLREVDAVTQWLRVGGVLMWALGGWLAVFQRHAGRALGYAVLAEQGVALAVLGAGGAQRAALYFALWPARLVALAVWSGALAALQVRSEGLAYARLRGLARRYPLLSLAAVIGAASLVGAPGLGGFPGRLFVWSLLAKHGRGLLLASLWGTLGLGGAVLRLLTVLTLAPRTAHWALQEQPAERVLTVLGVVVLLGLGWFPAWGMSWAAWASQWLTALGGG